MTNGQSQKTLPVETKPTMEPVSVLTTDPFVEIIVKTKAGEPVTITVDYGNGEKETKKVTSGDIGQAGANMPTPKKPGKYQVTASVDSTGETTSSTLTAREPGSGPKPK